MFWCFYLKQMEHAGVLCYCPGSMMLWMNLIFFFFFCTDSFIEEAVIPGRTPPKECSAEAHTDYDGVAVRWGLTFHVESAADCCQACIDQAKAAKPGQIKCNIWVYCPEEAGCYSPDIYEHKHHECWLKQVLDVRSLHYHSLYWYDFL